MQHDRPADATSRGGAPAAGASGNHAGAQWSHQHLRSGRYFGGLPHPPRATGGGARHCLGCGSPPRPLCGRSRSTLRTGHQPGQQRSATPSGPQGTVQLASGTRPNGESFFVIRDDGPGIPDEHVPHIFERFYRADKARTSAAGHTGLGLAIAKAIVDNHGGEISVQSTPGQGSTFEVTLKSDRSL
ncbi:sensor histidine kinase [Verrucomicrobium spinosum]|uniref:sensor histidine kinase n=1 Tax=Verrucomicrobium spinosum TaxID=2736 RepID=UPI001C45248E